MAAASLVFNASDNAASEPATPTTKPNATGAPPSATGAPRKQREYSDLKIHRGDANQFAGEVTLHNPTKYDVWVLATVNM